MDTDLAYRRSVWALLVERGVEDGAELNLYWGETAAAQAARRYLTQAWPIADAVPADVQDAIERYNRLPGVAEHVLLAPFPIEGHQSIDGDQDPRIRFTACISPHCRLMQRTRRAGCLPTMSTTRPNESLGLIRQTIVRWIWT